MAVARWVNDELVGCWLVASWLVVGGWLIGGQLVDSWNLYEFMKRMASVLRQNPFGELLLLCAAGFISRSGRTKVGPGLQWWGDGTHDGSMIAAVRLLATMTEPGPCNLW